MFVKFLCYFAIATCYNHAYATAVVNYDGHKIIRITVQAQEEIQILQTLKNEGVSFMLDVLPVRKHSDIIVSPDQLDMVLEILEQNEILYEEIINDIGELIRSQKANQKPIKNGKLYWDQYNTLSDITEFLEAQPTDNPSAADVLLQNIGTSYEGRNLTIIKISKSGFTKPAIWIDATIHAREWITSSVSTYIIDQLVHNMEPEIQRLSVDFDFYILPILNPDGYEYTHIADRLWRKTRSQTNSTLGCMGVDGNRNYDAFWMENGGASSDPCSNNYAGSHAFSEPETNATAEFLMTIRDRLVLYLSLHSAGQYILLPTGASNVSIPEYDEYERIGNLAAAAHLVPYETNFTVGNVVNLMYVATGSSMDWAYLLNPPNLRLAVTYELRDKGRFGHLLPPEQILPSCEEFMEGFKALVNELRVPMPPTSAPTTTVPTSIPTTVSTNIPTTVSTSIPTTVPTSIPTTVPTTVPTNIPTTVPTNIPTTVPTNIPTTVPTNIPTTVPTNIPTTVPTNIPTTVPTTVMSQTSVPTTVTTT